MEKKRVKGSYNTGNLLERRKDVEKWTYHNGLERVEGGRRSNGTFL